MRKLVLFDIDGTLRDEVLGIPPSVSKALAGLKAKQHQTAICTGRSIGMIQDDVMELGIENIIAGGGNYILHKEEKISDDGFSREKIKLLWTYFEKMTEKAGCVFEGNYEIYMNEIAADILSSMNMEKSKRFTREQRYNFFKNEKIDYKDNFCEFQSEVKIHKVSVWCNSQEFRKIAAILGEESIELAQQGRHAEYGYYEIVKKETGKGSAVHRLCRYLGIRTEDTVAFGDGRNDIDMLKVCGTSIAMKNSSEELLPYADSICEAPMDDGIYLELKRRGLIEELDVE